MKESTGEWLLKGATEDQIMLVDEWLFGRQRAQEMHDERMERMKNNERKTGSESGSETD